MPNDPELDDAFRVLVWRAVIVIVVALGVLAHAKFYGG